MKRFISILLACGGMAAQLWAEDPLPKSVAEPGKEPPAVKIDLKNPLPRDSRGLRGGEQRKLESERSIPGLDNAKRRRRFEIMVLLQSYRLMPEDQRAAIMTELRKRVKIDFDFELEQQKARVMEIEAELKRLQQDIAEREKNSEKLVTREVERLMKLPAEPPRRGRRPPVEPNADAPDDAPENPPEPPATGHNAER